MEGQIDVSTPAQVDVLTPDSQGFYGQSPGSVGQRLINSEMNYGVLRPFLYNGKSWMTINVAGNPKTIRANTTATLNYDEWKAIDTAVVKIARERLVAANDLQSRGLTRPISNGLGTTVLQWATISDIEGAEIDMAGQKQSYEDRVVYEQNYLPLPIIHKSFSLDLRTLSASRKSGDPLDTTLAEQAARRVAEKVEDILLLGSSSFAFGGGTIYGYLDHPSRNTVTLASNWDASATTGQDILDDHLAMMKSGTNDRHYGPFVEYIPTDYEDILSDDYKSNSDKTTRERLLQLSKLSDIRAADRLTADNVLFVEMIPENIKLVIGMPVTTVQWEEQGGFLLKFKIMTIMVPWIRPDQEGRLGIIHLSA